MIDQEIPKTYLQTPRILIHSDRKADFHERLQHDFVNLLTALQRILGCVDSIIAVCVDVLFRGTVELLH